MGTETGILTENDVKVMLKTIAELDSEINLMAQTRANRLREAYESRVPLDVREAIEADQAKIREEMSDTQLGETKFSIESVVLAWAKKVGHGIETEHAVVKVVKGRRSGPTVSEMETFARLMPAEIATQALRMIKTGETTYKIDVK